MPRFGVAFNRRKSTATAEDFQNAQVATPEQSSFRVIERNDPAVGKSFDGGVRLARASGTIPKHTNLELEDNMFADLKGNRGSGASTNTKTTSTDTSSRHSNASTAPSSADLAHDDWKHGHKKNLHDIPGRGGLKSSGSGFLNRAGRTFSFGQKKHGSSSPTKDDSIPDVPAIPIKQQDSFNGRARGLTESTTSTATPPKLEGGGLDLGGDFGSMFSSFDKRASAITLKNDGTTAPRSLTNPAPRTTMQPAPLTIEKTMKPGPSPESWHSRNSNDGLLGSSTPTSPDRDLPPPVPRHQSSFKTSSRPSDIIEDEDAKLLQDSITVGRLLSSPNNYSSPRFEEEDTFSSLARKPLNQTSFRRGDDNMFEGSLAHSSRVAHRFTSRPISPPRNKVMTPAQFEKYRKDKERQGTTDEVRKSTSNDDDEDEINYDDDEDEIEKSKQQAKQRRKQEAHMAVYRQQMMKVTGEKPDEQPQRPGLPLSMSAPQLSQIKTPSPVPPGGVSDEDEDDEVPLAILQAHGFPGKNRPPTRLDNMGSNPNLRATAQQQARPVSMLGDGGASNNPNQRHSTLPAFARGLPQDPFVGAGIAKPAIRESIHFSGGIPASQSQQSLPVGGLVGVIANEERSRAMRRGSPNIDGQKLLPGMNGAQGQGFDPITGIPAHMMYNNNNMGGGMPGMAGMGGMQGMGGQGMGMGGMPGMPQMPPMLTVGDQAQLQMTQQMSQFMQMQMQFMQMMATNQGGGAPSMMQPPYGGYAASQSMNDLSSRHSMMGDQMLEPPRRMDPGMRTMSMVQPSSASFVQHPGYAGSIRGSGMGMGYAPSIAPSERSNIGLPGRYRPVSQAPNTLLAVSDNHRRTNTMSGALGNRWDESKAKPTINVVSRAGDASDDDDEEGWEAMKAKREKKRSLWKNKKGLSTDLRTMI